MDKYLDYQNYLKEHQDILKILEKQEFFIYERIVDVISVLDAISKQARVEKKVDNEVEMTFDIGFDYLYNELIVIEEFYNDFNKDVLLFKQYDLAIDYILLINELIIILESDNKITPKAKKRLEKALETIISIIYDRKTFGEKEIEEIDNIISSSIPRGYEPDFTSFIFEDIAVEMALWDH